MDHITTRKIEEIENQGYTVSGQILSGEKGSVLVQCGAVRWIPHDQLYLIMHPDTDNQAVGEVTIDAGGRWGLLSRDLPIGTKLYTQPKADHIAALSDELQKAHAIIKNALACMDISAKLAWGVMNRKAGCAGEGDTRANEREAVLTIYGKVGN